MDTGGDDRGLPGGAGEVQLKRIRTTLLSGPFSSFFTDSILLRSSLVESLAVAFP